MKITNQDKLFLSWLRVSIRHNEQYAKAYKEFAQRKYKISEEIKKKYKGYPNVLNFYETFARVHESRSMDYKVVADTLKNCLVSFKNTRKKRVDDERFLKKSQANLRNFLKKNKPGAVDITTPGISIEKGRIED